MFIYYVYAYLRKDGSPYYIGKGKGNRAYASNDHITKPPKNKNHIVFLETNLSNVGACALERRYILWYGRKDNETGILRNMTDGGEGISGLTIPPFKNKRHSEETKNKMVAAKIGKRHSEETLLKMRKPKSEDHKRKISKANKGRYLTENHKKKISVATKGRIPWNKGIHFS